MESSTDEIRRWVVRQHRDRIDTTVAIADEVARAIDGPRDRLQSNPRWPMGQAIEERGLTAEYAAVLETLRARFGDEGGPEIVPAPPYVTTSSRGPVLRLPSDRGRLVIDLAVFEVVAGDQVTYRRRGREATEVVCVRWRSRDAGER